VIRRPRLRATSRSRFGVALAAIVLATGCGSSGTTSSSAPGANHRGGTLELLVQSSPDSIDTAVAYTFPIQQLLVDTGDGLVGFRKVAGSAGEQIVADLATAVPKPTDGARTYAFRLRHGIHFSDGRLVTPQDFTYTFERLFKVPAPTASSFYGNIVGAAQCLKSPSRCNLASGVVADSAAWTVTFHLVNPDPEFLDKLALTFAFVVPSGTPNHDIGVHPIPATGPYVIKSYDPNSQLVMVRNAYFHQWSAAAQPAGYPNQIVLRFGVPSESEVTEVENGQADWMADQPPADRLGELGTKFASQVHVKPLEATSFVALNTRVAPFNQAGVRQAVNYAVDRAAVIKLYGGPNLGTPTCQVLPPGFPGYRPYCPYTRNPTAAGKWVGPDLTKARALVAASHTRGMAVSFYSQSDSVNRAIGSYMVDVLNKLGYRATLKVLNTNAFVGVVSNSASKAQLFGYTWYQDYPAASDFINNQFSCSSFTPHSDANIDFAEFCDPVVDAGIRHAFALEAANNPTAANQVWAGLDRRITNEAPWLPLFTPKLVDFVSKRVGNYQFNPLWYFLVDQAWVR
jgi:peptide/nickel transport system substrate-binding protein